MPKKFLLLTLAAVVAISTLCRLCVAPHPIPLEPRVAASSAILHHHLSESNDGDDQPPSEHHRHSDDCDASTSMIAGLKPGDSGAPWGSNYGFGTVFVSAPDFDARTNIFVQLTPSSHLPMASSSLHLRI
ncbi:MAG: hypothetical protein EXQ56_08060 [Acidobacteria bacterium]|nr:hypothetical protein [Acidobacteriota bacterium]